MNPTIIVQQNLGVPTISLTTADSGASLIESRKSVAAIIRPKPRDTGHETIRLEAPESTSPQPHMRTIQLDNYVQWLQEIFQQDESDVRPAADAETTAPQSSSIAADVEPVAAETVQGPSLSDGDVFSNSCFSTITTESTGSYYPGPIAAESLQRLAKTGATADSRQDQAKFHGFSITKLDRIDSPHNGLPNTHVALDEFKTSGEGTRADNFDADPADPMSSKTKSPAPKKLTARETENFIATISKAIASVLTDTPEPEFEQKVRSHFETELLARAAHAIAPAEIDSIDTDKLDHAPVTELAQSGGIPAAAIKTEAEKIATEILTSARKEIPTSIAAWDVQDFRWPVVTDQIIVSGGEALDQLAQTTFDMITPGQQRIAIAGLGRGEGTTSIAISLARWAAACGKNVLLVDADLVTPGLSTQVGLAPNISWINAVSQSLPSAEVIVRSQKSNLCIMPLAQVVSRAAWPRFIYDNLGELIDQVQSHFDVVLLDVGPANQLMAELSRSSSLVDATMLVYNGVNSPEFKKTKSRLEMFGLNKFIVAQNRAQQKSVNVA